MLSMILSPPCSDNQNPEILIMEPTTKAMINNTGDLIEEYFVSDGF